MTDPPTAPTPPEPAPIPESAADAILRRLDAIDRQLEALTPGAASDRSGRPAGRPIGPGHREPRRFTLLDAMILIAFIAPGLMLGRPLLDLATFDRAPPVNLLFEGIGWVGMATTLLVPSVACVTIGVLLLRVGPRPGGWPAWRRDPDLAPLLAMAAAIALTGPFVMLCFASGRGGPAGMSSAAFLMPLPVAMAVIGSWVALGAVGHRRPNQDWIDRASSFLGWFWIAAAVPCFWAIFLT